MEISKGIGTGIRRIWAEGRVVFLTACGEGRPSRAAWPAGFALAAMCAWALAPCASAVHAAEGFSPRVVDGQGLVSPVNRGGPDAWPGQKLSTQGMPPGAMPSFMPGAPVPAGSAVPPPLPGEAASAPAPVPNGPATPPPAAAMRPEQAPAAPPAAAMRPGPAPDEPLPSAAMRPEPAPAEEEPPQAAPAPAQAAAQEPAAPAEGEPEREVRYVDEQGNPVPKPVDPAKMMAEAEELYRSGKYEGALHALRQLKSNPGISRETLLDVLYMISDCLWAQHKKTPLEGYKDIMAATSEALNADWQFERAPAAMLRRGMINILVDDPSGAAAEIMALHRRFPASTEAAEGLNQLGYLQLKHKLHNEAIRSFGIVLDKYPESKVLEPASMGLSKALHYARRPYDAQTIFEFVSKRWPRAYLNDLDYILVQAANNMLLGREGVARDLYWLYLNLDPKREGNDAILLSVGDMYAKKKDWHAATTLYDQLVQYWPDSEPAITARMRLAEGGVWDSPISYDAMTTVFSLPRQKNLDQEYQKISDLSTTQPAAVISRLKHAMWLFWNNHYTEAMGRAADFVDNYPEHANVEQARDLIWNAFQKEYVSSLAEQNYGRILILWNGFPLVRQRFGEIDATMRNALAQGYKERGEDGKFLELIAEFLRSPKNPDYGEMAFTEYFNRYLQTESWQRILDLARVVQSWDMDRSLRLQLDYAMALSAQNLEMTDTALAMWRQIAARKEFPLYQRAYATYFLARDAADRSDIREAYDYNRQVLDYFTQLAQEHSEKSDPERIKEAIAALMDICEVANRLPEALKWVDRYRVYVPDEKSEDYPGLRYREARLYRKLGDTARAKALLENIIAAFPDSPFSVSAKSELRTFEVSRDLQNYLGTTTATGSPQPGT